MNNAHCYHSLLPRVQRTLGICVCGTIALVFLVMLAGFHLTPVHAAALVPDDLNDQVDPFEQKVPVISHTEQLIRDVQRDLLSLEFYKGPVTGVLDDETDTAIRRYQRSRSIPETGIVDENLADELKAVSSVNVLLRKLSIARETQTQETRNALLNNPATRDLILDNVSDAVADPTRDPSQCFAAPTVRCLLDEALENAKAVTRNNMRDWAYSDILISQARAGLTEAARNTVRHISDPRIIMAALGEIAESQAHAGHAANAIAAADAVPDIHTRLDSYANMARILADRGDISGTRAVVQKLLATVETMAHTVKLAGYEAQAAAALLAIGDQDFARDILNEIKLSAAQSMSPGHRDTALRYVADTLANGGYVDDALTLLQDIESSDERMPVLMSAARAEAEDGDPEAALAMAKSIDAVRYRSLILVNIAEGKARMGHVDAALSALQDAANEIHTIDLPFARDFATSRIAIAYARVARAKDPPHEQALEQAQLYAESIADQRLAAYSIWQIAFTRTQGKGEISDEDVAVAMAATNRILSPSGQIWLLAELAEDRAVVGDDAQAWLMFDRALGLSVPINNTWGKSRALSRLALSLVRLVETDINRAIED